MQLYNLCVLLPVALNVALVRADPIFQHERTTAQQCGQAGSFFDPRRNGGSMLDASAGLGEPLNVIISGQSSPDVLDATGKFIYYANAIGFSYECLGIHIGNPQQANLGDGRGWVNQTAVIREDYGNSELGTCKESLIGGNHFRVYPQQGTCALFLAVSIEENASTNHNIAANGYDAGRDALVAGAIGERQFNGVKYMTTAETIEGLLPVGSQGINHDIAIDGKVVLLTVTILK
ncbi:hypothetical protein J3R30DRAFT_143294 [Lentinula aciculospora]|uniref:Ecp2 effector protein domain-containing protein n=1 Tax=Lentinula aciculospora TaxID=153920 RepID=A0A9W9AVN4_9AGAR|nr:hypothetical protein J3R30DRAFT_1849520 [Lentinula aciculospora]KAJ4490844.1 hypothetical protein J3R30DRAFT_143294 [Lentinula aciculospora]